MAELISSTEASKHFSDILSKVYYLHKSFEIKRGREIVAKVIPVAANGKKEMRVKDLPDFFEHLPKLDNGDAADFAKIVGKMRSVKYESEKWD